jgi:hypothetical protein
VTEHSWPVFETILGSQAAFGTTLESQAVIAKPVTSSPKRDPGRIFTIRYVILLKHAHAETLFWIFLTKR